PATGAKLAIVGRRITMKSAALVPVPAGVVTVIRPVTAVAGTVVVMLPSETTSKMGCTTEPNLTTVAPVRVPPEIVTGVPGVACDGVNETMRGATRKPAALVTGPAGLTTPMRPVVAPAGTGTRIEVADRTVTGPVLTPLKVTLVTLARLVPFSVTSAPSGPTVGLKLLRVGALMTTNGAGLIAVPPGVVTLTVPVAAVPGTVAVMVWSSITVKGVAT